MIRESALILCVLVFAIISLLSYYGAKVKTWSSIVFGIFISLAILNIFYPPSQIATDEPNFTLLVYAIIEILGFIILCVYISLSTLSNVRKC